MKFYFLLKCSPERSRSQIKLFKNVMILLQIYRLWHLTSYLSEKVKVLTLRSTPGWNFRYSPVYV